jgi:hypothetical protein
MMSTTRAEWLKLKAEWDREPVQTRRYEADDDDDQITEERN